MMATWDAPIARLFAMRDDVWERHANPWSVWTRVASGALPFLAIWSHAWWGWPWAIAALAVAALWLWANPRAFPPPVSTRSWAARAVLGERVWTNRKAVPIPGQHAFAAALLSALAGLGALVALAGAVLDHVWLLVTGIAVMYLGKLWFCDRMVWLYDDMKDADPIYRSWLR